ncbi:MAG: 16S rRNA (cytosine(967)-C(5))-methyltransferase RsmB [Bacillota bacterium]
MKENNPRAVVVALLVATLKDGAYNSVALRKTLKNNESLTVQNKAFVTELFNGTLRNIYYVDHCINTVSSLSTEKMKPFVLALLRSATYELIFMHTPNHAVCNEAVALIEDSKYKGLKGFVNGVLRTLQRTKEEIPMPEIGTPLYLSVQYSHPLWLVQMWIAYYGFETTEAICKENGQSPKVTVRRNTHLTLAENLLAMWQAEGVLASEGLYCKGEAYFLKQTADMSCLPSFQKGYFHVQDESSQMAVAILDPQKGETVLDLCAAPGGKTMTIAERMENTGRVVACDIFPNKLELLAETKERLQLTIIEETLQDGLQFVPKWEGKFDRVLVDVPCSGLGLLRKKPDIRLKKTGEEIDTLLPIQRQILETAARYVKAGGVLVYSTCTLSKKENEGNVSLFLKQNEAFSLADISGFVPENLQNTIQQKGMVTLLPNLWHTDGFFIAKMIRSGKEQI